MKKMLVLKALANETRMQIVLLLLKNNYCVGALARKLEITEGAVSQQLKILREAGLLNSMNKGYFTHYNVNIDVLNELAVEIKKLASINRGSCNGDCDS